jgi:hypothetical protein
MNIPEGDSGRRKSPTRDELRAWRTFTETTDLVKRRIEAELQQAGVSSGDYAPRRSPPGSAGSAVDSRTTSGAWSDAR